MADDVEDHGARRKILHKSWPTLSRETNEIFVLGHFSGVKNGIYPAAIFDPESADLLINFLIS